ncbi:MAG: LapA family protein [Desulfobacterales bacterium]|nr:LapA family protein [Desulfobacterales bacterium]
MRSVKLVSASLIIIFIVLVVIQNLGIFLHTEPLKLNLLVWKKQTAPIHISVYFLGFFLIGLLISYFHGLAERFKAKRTIKGHLENIRKLEDDIAALKSRPAAEQTTSQEESEGA